MAGGPRIGWTSAVVNRMGIGGFTGCRALSPGSGKREDACRGVDGRKRVLASRDLLQESKCQQTSYVFQERGVLGT